MLEFYLLLQLLLIVTIFILSLLDWLTYILSKYYDLICIIIRNEVIIFG